MQICNKMAITSACSLAIDKDCISYNPEERKPRAIPGRGLPKSERGEWRSRNVHKDSSRRDVITARWILAMSEAQKAYDAHLRNLAEHDWTI